MKELHEAAEWTINMNLLFNEPAKNWLEALPLGNGHLGAMVYGGEQAKFQLTENTFWSGREREKEIPAQATATMDKVRELLRKGDNAAAQKAFLEGYICDAAAFGTQLPLADLFVAINKKANAVSRSLNLFNGVVQEQLIFDMDIKRITFISHSAKLLCMCMSSEKEMPEVKISISAEHIKHISTTDNEIQLTCEAREGLHSDFSCGVDATCMLQIKTDGITFTNNNNELIIKDAKSIEAYLAVKTNFECNNPKDACIQFLNNTNKSFDTLLAEHMQDFKSKMDKCKLTLSKSINKTITRCAVEKFKQTGSDLLVEEALFQMGRYMLLITSREDSLVPAALQGVLNDNLACRMPWANDVHININTQMNYTHAETTGLSACTIPLFNYIKNRLSVDGTIAAKNLYHARGWVGNTVSNLFGYAPPRSNQYWWALSHTCGGWLATHIWEHYLYTQDKIFLAEYFTIMRSSAVFMLDMMEPHPKTGELVANPSYSPENSFYLNGEKTSLCIGSTFDRNVAVAMFKAVIDAAQVLDIKDDLIVQELKKALTIIPPLRKGGNGQLMEWYEDYKETDLTHRHTSNLLCLYPFKEITKFKNANALEWAAKSLEYRCANEDKFICVTWCGAQVTSHYAMLHNGEIAGHIHKTAAKKIIAPNMLLPHGDNGIYEMDGNTGYTAAVVDMLMQSNEEYIEFLPALPLYWENGSITNLTAVGNISVNLEWQNGKFDKATLRAEFNCTKVIIYNDKQIELKLISGTDYNIDNFMII